MSRSCYLTFSGIVFVLVACLHLARLLFGWQVQVDSWIMPSWLSWIGVILAGWLGVWSFRLRSKE